MFDFKVTKELLVILLLLLLFGIEWSCTQKNGLFTYSFLFWLTNFDIKLPMNTEFVDLGEP